MPFLGGSLLDQLECKLLAGEQGRQGIIFLEASALEDCMYSNEWVSLLVGSRLQNTENIVPECICFSEDRNSGFIDHVMLHIGFYGTDMKMEKWRDKALRQPLASLKKQMTWFVPGGW